MIFGNFEFGSSLVGSGGSALDWYIPSSSSSNGSKKCQLTVVLLIGICYKKYGAIVKGSSDPSHLFLKSMSERVGSDIERLWNCISRSTQNRLKMLIQI